MSGAECREDPVLDISLAAPRRLFPGWGKFSIRGQLLLQVVAITVIAFSVSAFAVWKLYEIRASFDQVRNTLRPARAALQLAKELEHIYGLSEAYQLSFNQPEQRQEISTEIEDARGKLVGNLNNVLISKEILNYSGTDLTAGI